MCGIAGFIGKGSEETLREMINCIVHRGPDYQGYYYSDNIALGHARLSIIDLSPEAHQPFFNNNRSLAIIFNGEIYNFLELKKDLEKTDNYIYRTRSDTEVILNLFEKYGENFLGKLNGMFAIAIYDFQKQRLLLARDRMGKKPLYYSVVNNNIIFCSELKALLKHPLINADLNLESLYHYLTFEYVPSPDSIINNIKKIEPASFLIWENGKIQKNEKYWKTNFKTSEIGFEEAKESLNILLEDAVKSRLVSDVPLGIFLSGGLDSSTIAYYAARNSTKKIKTFSIGFEDKSYDESEYAQKVAAFLGTDHYTQILTPKHTLELIPEILKNTDEPFADPSIIPFYLLSKFTRQKVTVALGGDGSDELIAGYPTFISHRFINIFRYMPLKNALLSLMNLFPPSDINISTDFKIKQFLRGFSENKNSIHTLWLGAFLPKEKKKLLQPEIYDKIVNKNIEAIERYNLDVESESFYNRTTYTYYNTYLLDDILVKVDRASMMNSLECRSPFLDYRLVDFFNSLPRSYKLNGLKTKFILKDLMKDKLPEEIVFRSKKGFGIPVSSWLRNELKDLCCDLLSPEYMKNQGIFQPDFVEKLKMEHFSKKRNNRKLLWTLMMFQIWYKTYLKQ